MSLPRTDGQSHGCNYMHVHLHFYVVHASIILTRSVCPCCAPKLSYNAMVIESHLYVFSYRMATKTILCTWHYSLYCKNRTFLTVGYNCEIFWLTQREGQVCKQPLPTITSLRFSKGKCNGEQLMICIMCYGHLNTPGYMPWMCGPSTAISGLREV